MFEIDGIEMAVSIGVEIVRHGVSFILGFDLARICYDYSKRDFIFEGICGRGE